MKLAYKELNPYHWGVLLVLLVTLAGAIYAVTTWDNSSVTTGSYHRESVELPDQTRAAGLQVQTGDNGLSGSTSSETLQAPASSTQSNSVNYEVPPNPEPCRGADMGPSVMCMAQ